MGAAVSAANVDFILVGDSLGTTLLGYETTIPVTMNDMVRHTSASAANPQCLVVADLPFGEAASLMPESAEGSCRRAEPMPSKLKAEEMWLMILKNWSLPEFLY